MSTTTHTIRRVTDNLIAGAVALPIALTFQEFAKGITGSYGFLSVMCLMFLVFLYLSWVFAAALLLDSFAPGQPGRLAAGVISVPLTVISGGVMLVAVITTGTHFPSTYPEFSQDITWCILGLLIAEIGLVILGLCRFRQGMRSRDSFWQIMLATFTSMIGIGIALFSFWTSQAQELSIEKALNVIWLLK